MSVIAKLKNFAVEFRNEQSLRQSLPNVSAIPRLHVPVSEAIRNQPNERLKMVESRREQLLEDHSPIDLVDFGAGSLESGAHSDGKHSGRYFKSSVSQAASPSKAKTWARFLYYLTKSEGPAAVLELGTCVGISGSYIGTALKEAGKGKLVTLEGDPERARIARQTFAAMGLADISTVIVGPFQSTLATALDDYGPFDLVFIDGHHVGEATVAYFEQIRPRLSGKAMVVLDDIHWSESMEQGWKRIRELEANNVDMTTLGIVLVGS